LRLTTLLVLVAAATLLGGAVAPGAQKSPYVELRPVDEASQQADFFTFRAHLQAAIGRRDRAALLSAVSANIRISFGDDNGRDAFERQWHLDSADSELWGTLGATLALGGTFEENGTFVAPYTFSRWPDNLDAFEHVVVVGARVRIRAAPSLDGDTIGAVSFAVLPLARASGQGTSTPEWTAVQLDGRRTGYIASRYVRSPIDYRAIFARVGDGWQLITFVAGD
jgi:hypothetical protein